MRCWLQLELPKPVASTVGLLADAASPVALFTIGAVLLASVAILAPYLQGLSGYSAWDTGLVLAPRGASGARKVSRKKPPSGWRANPRAETVSCAERGGCISG